MSEFSRMRGVMLRPAFVELTGDITSGAVLSVAVYRQERVGEGVSWEFTRAEWREAIGIKRAALERARATLRKLGVLKEERAGGDLNDRVLYLVDLPLLLGMVGIQPRPESSLGANPATTNDSEARHDSSLGVNPAYVGSQPRLEPSRPLGLDPAYPRLGSSLCKEERTREQERATCTHTREASPSEPDGDAERLVGELLVTLATRRQAYAPLTVQERDHAKALVKTESTFGASLRSLAAMHPDAWPEVVPRFLQGGDLEDKLSQGYRPRDLAYLRSVLSGWTPDQRPRGQSKPSQNGTPAPQESPRRPNVVNPIYAKRLGYVQREDGSWFNEKTGAVFVP